MHKPIIHFAHANGFPAPTYRQFFSGLNSNFEINYLPVHAHNPEYPVTNNWTELVEELVNHLKQRYSQPVIGMGHSLGGVLTFLAAIKYPELYSSIIILDSPILSPARSRMLAWAKKIRLLEKSPMISRVPKRRMHWASREEAFVYFHGRKALRYFDEKALWDYVLFGTEEDQVNGGFKLAFDPAIEYQIFKGLPDHLPSFRGQLRVPAGLVCGEFSYALNESDRNYAKKHHHMKIAMIKAGHLFPFERPLEAAEICQKMIGELSSVEYNRAR